ncbi:MAG: deoxyribose-phosphate aldolase [Collinsella sp.]|nr:deoxyribose-phosphate aldolase [Collinsella sp.]
MSLTKSELASYMDHTLLKADATAERIDAVIAEARELGCASVCVNGAWVPRVAAGLADSAVATCAVIGFPLGAGSTAAKVAEAADVVAAGAAEVDMVINMGWLKSGDEAAVHDDIAAVADACHAGGAILKVIIECCLLTDAEKVRACELSREVGADFVKTSTGFSTGGATPADVALMRATVGPEMGVKAAGGIRTLADALAMIDAGANRLGVSAAPAILAELDA